MGSRPLGKANGFSQKVPPLVRGFLERKQAVHSGFGRRSNFNNCCVSVEPLMLWWVQITMFSMESSEGNGLGARASKVGLGDMR